MNKHKTRVAAAATLLVTAVAIAASPRPTDYAQGIRVDAYSGRPLVGSGSARSSVSNGDACRSGRRSRVQCRRRSCSACAVCHCNDAVNRPSPSSRCRCSSLQAPAVAGSDATRIEVATAGGTQVRIAEGQNTAGTAAGTQTWAHVIDARGSSDDLRSIEFDWQSPDGASQANVRVEASDGSGSMADGCERQHAAACRPGRCAGRATVAAQRDSAAGTTL